MRARARAAALRNFDEVSTADTSNCSRTPLPSRERQLCNMSNQFGAIAYLTQFAALRASSPPCARLIIAANDNRSLPAQFRSLLYSVSRSLLPFFRYGRLGNRYKRLLYFRLREPARLRAMHSRLECRIEPFQRSNIVMETVNTVKHPYTSPNLRR